MYTGKVCTWPALKRVITKSSSERPNAKTALDDFVITRFNAGQVQTFPVYIYLKVQKGIPPQVNAFATLFFVATVSLVAIGALLQRRRANLKP